MQVLENLGELLGTFVPFLTVVAAVMLAVAILRWLLLGRGLIDNERRLPRQLVLVALGAIGVVVSVLALPVPDATRNQLLTVLGLLVSAIIALSSTTLVANAMAGLMLRTTKSFRTGDFIRVNGQFGRVTERGLLDTEIQTEDRELTTLPNLYLISNPVTVVRSSGTLVSTTLSLGYDVHHARIESLLVNAARRAELDEPFVRLLELGNFSVTYRVSGFLSDIKNLLTARSNLCKMVLDELHGHGIEIMSPSFMNQRPIAADKPVIPTPIVELSPKSEERSAEELMFDKAEEAERIEHERIELQARIAELEGQLGQADADSRDAIGQELATRRDRLAQIENATVVRT